MQMAIISPIAGLERYSALTNTQMALYHIQDPRYWDFYRRRVKSGDLVFLDCGAYEGVEFNIESYIERILDLTPSVVILPDLLLYDWKRSFAYSIGMMEYIMRRIDTPFEFMFVPQAQERDASGFVTCLHNAISEGLRWIGLPRCMNTHIFKIKYARISQAQFLKTMYPGVKVHALGYGGWLDEIKELEAQGVYSWDTGSAVWRGWNGRLMSENWTDIPLDFTAKESKFNDIILKNLEACYVNTSEVGRSYSV